MAWKMTERVGSRVARSTFAELEEALLGLEQRVRELAQEIRREPVDVRYRSYQPAEQVAARIELSGPGRRVGGVHAGVDVRGDGSIESYLGRARRVRLEPGQGEDAVQALRRALAH